MVSSFSEVRVGSNICLDRSSGSPQFVLLCDVQPRNLTQGIRSAVPTPRRIWTTEPDDVVIYEALDGESPDFNPRFFMSDFRLLLMPGIIPGIPVLDIAEINGGLVFNTLVTSNLTSNLTILPDLPRRDAESIGQLVFEEILGSYTCMVENEYGADAATTIISECDGKCFYCNGIGRYKQRCL